MSEKISRKELKAPDGFMKAAGSIVRSYSEHKKSLMYAAIVIVVILIGVSVYSDFAKKKGNEASFALAEVRQELEKADGKLSNPIESKYKDMIKKFGGTFPALTAKMELADLYFKEGKHNDSLDLFVEIYSSSSHNIYKAVSLINIGYIKETLKDYKGAIEYFEGLLEFNMQVFEIQAHFALSRCYEKLNDIEKAKSSYNEIISKFPNSEHAKQARMYLSMLDS